MQDDTKSLAPEAPAAQANAAPLPGGPVMDVMPPPTVQDSGEVAVEAEPEPDQPTPAATQPTAPAAVDHTKVNTKAQKPNPTQVKTHTAPVAAIVLAILTFIALAGLAYYAYSKG